MTLSPGTTLGSFEISGLLGVGGMGEVYRAKDTKLGREVAIKVLPEAFAKDANRLARFEREAKLLAVLNHPNIAAIHELGSEGGACFLVMELVEGITLNDRLAAKPLSVEEALGIFGQIAEALEYAHEQGVVHRDLKPANLKITDDGKAKVLDFGLAKAFEDRASIASSLGGTLALDEDSVGLTGEGKILGTPAYMSPEQARGAAVDKRADIWAFGCCLFEALVGKRPFVGPTATDLMAAIIAHEPDWNQLPPETPARVRVLLWRCLQKDPHRRLRDIGEARFELSETGSDPSGTIPVLGTTTGPSTGSPGRALLYCAAAFIIGVALTAALLFPRSQKADEPIVKISIRPPNGAVLDVGSEGNPFLAIAPDGSSVAYVAESEGRRRLYLHRLDELEAAPFANVEDPTAPFYSPDGRSIAFFTDDQLMRIPVAGGPLESICDVNNGIVGTWGTDGNIVFGIWGSTGLRIVPASGGTPKDLTQLDITTHYDHDFPSYHHDGRRVFYSRFPVSGLEWNERSDILVDELDGSDSIVLSERGNYPRYSRTGHLIFARGDALVALLLDSKGVEPRGRATPVLEGVMVNAASGTAHYDLSRNGHLAYVPGSLNERREIAVVDRDGATHRLDVAPELYMFPSVSPDGKFLAITARKGRHNVLQVLELDAGRPPMVYVSRGRVVNPIWSPKGEWIGFGYIGDDDLYPKLARISLAQTDEEPQIVVDDATPTIPYAWTPETDEIVYIKGTLETQWDLYSVRSDGSAEPAALVEIPSFETSPSISPDGKWLAFASDRSGEFEIYVQSYPSGRMRRFTSEGGWSPIWSRNRENLELYYRDDSRMMAVPIAADPELEIGEPQLLFEIDAWVAASIWPSYDVTPDGRFVLVLNEEGDSQASNEIIVVLNWERELLKKVAAGQN